MGEPGRATILATEEAGITINRNYPLAKLRPRIEPPDDDPYEATAKCLINRFEIPTYQPGARVAVVIDPKDRSKVAVA